MLFRSQGVCWHGIPISVHEGKKWVIQKCGVCPYISCPHVSPQKCGDRPQNLMLLGGVRPQYSTRRGLTPVFRPQFSDPSFGMMLLVFLHRASHPKQASAWEFDGGDRKVASGLMADLDRSVRPEACRVEHCFRAVGLSKIAYHPQ